MDFNVNVPISMPDEQLTALFEKMYEEGYLFKFQKCKNCKYFNNNGCAILIVDESDKPTENDYCSFFKYIED